MRLGGAWERADEVEIEPFRPDTHPDHRVVLGRFAPGAQETRERGCVIADRTSLGFISFLDNLAGKKPCEDGPQFRITGQYGMEGNPRCAGQGFRMLYLRGTYVIAKLRLFLSSSNLFPGRRD